MKILKIFFEITFNSVKINCKQVLDNKKFI